MQSALLLVVCAATTVNAFYYKRNPYGDANEDVVPSPDYFNAYYGFPSFPPQEARRRTSFNLYPPQVLFRREHPFDFGPFGHRTESMGDAGLVVEKTERERAMQNAKPGFWRQRQLETMNRIKKIIGEKRMDVEQKHMKIRKVLANEGAELRSKFADLHKRLVMKNNKMVAAASETEKPKKVEKEAKPEAEKKEKTDEKLMLKAPESEKTELAAVNDSGSIGQPLPLSAPPMPSQMDLMKRAQPSQSVVEARQIRVSEDGKTIEI